MQECPDSAPFVRIGPLPLTVFCESFSNIRASRSKVWTVEPKLADHDFGPDGERRDPRRHRVLKSAFILQSRLESEIRCMVRNQHRNGVEIRLPQGVQVPETFLLYIPVDGIAYQSILRWRIGERAGLRFSGWGPKPSWCLI